MSARPTASRPPRPRRGKDAADGLEGGSGPEDALEACPRCGRPADELAYSHAAGAIVCEACHCTVAPLASAAARRYRRPKPPPPPKPSRYAQLVEEVITALQRAGEEVTGSRWAIGGLGSGTGRFTGYCPVCAVGLVDLQILNTDPPRVRTDGCSNGCSSDLIWDTLWPPT